MDYERYGDKPQIYEILIQGRLDAAWSDWLGGMAVTIGCEGIPMTRLTGTVADQSALRGILNRIWDLNLTLLAVNRIEIESQNWEG